MNSVPDRIDTLIFDLGGVIVDLSPEQTLTEFAALSNKSFTEILTKYSAHPAFFAYETGKIGEEEFRNTIRQIFDVEASDAQIDRCWNAMLIGIPPGKLTMLQRLKEYFTTLILSNTNSIHLDYINKIILGAKELDDYVHHAHYSHRLGMRKPDREIFEHVLNVHALTPEKTLFLDDNSDNIAAAKALGIEALLIEHPSRVNGLFKYYA